MAGFLIQTLRAVEEQVGNTEKMTLVVKKPYAYLKSRLQKVFEGQEDVEVVVDRRQAERRQVNNRVKTERRQVERRKHKETIVEISLSGKR